MGRGNVCVTGKYEGLYYIDNDDYELYFKDDECVRARDLTYAELTNEYTFDWAASQEELEYILMCFQESFEERFPEFNTPYRPGKKEWISGTQWLIAESPLFYVCAEDNSWSVAVELIQKELPWDDDGEFEKQQEAKYQDYLAGIRDSLLEHLPSIGTYAGAWTSGILTREANDVDNVIHSLLAVTNNKTKGEDKYR